MRTVTKIFSGPGTEDARSKADIRNLLLWPSGLRRRTFFPRSGDRWFKTQRQQRVDPAFHPFGVGEMGTSLDGSELTDSALGSKSSMGAIPPH